MQQLFDVLLNQEEVSWKALLYELVKTEQMDPWDLDISFLTQKYIGMVKEMQEHDLRISGKVLLAAAIMLKMKSSHLLENDISNLDRLINSTQEDDLEDELLEEFEAGSKRRRKLDNYNLIPRNPQPRNRKVSIQDLVQALEKAMSSKRKFLARARPATFKMPTKGMDLMTVIKDIYHKIVYYAKQEKALTFTHLLPEKAGRQEKVYTFVPLMHLENQKKVETSQKQHFGEISIKLKKGK
jgi:segregation and condensation protein A